MIHIDYRVFKLPKEKKHNAKKEKKRPRIIVK